jgi:integrase
MERSLNREAHLLSIFTHSFDEFFYQFVVCSWCFHQRCTSPARHTDIQTTMDIYTHVTDEAKEKTAEIFQKYMTF